MRLKRCRRLCGIAMPRITSPSFILCALTSGKISRHSLHAKYGPQAENVAIGLRECIQA